MQQRASYQFFDPGRVEFITLDWLGHKSNLWYDPTYLDARMTFCQSIGLMQHDFMPIIRATKNQYLRELNSGIEYEVGVTVLDVQDNHFVLGAAIFIGDVCYATQEAVCLGWDKNTQQRVTISAEQRAILNQHRSSQLDQPDDILHKNILLADKYTTPVRIRASHMGPLGVASAFSISCLLADARQQMLRAKGIVIVPMPGDENQTRQTIMIAANGTQYFHGLTENDSGLAIHSCVTKIGGTSLQVLSALAQGDNVMASQEVVGVFFVDGQKTPITGDVRQRLESLMPSV